MKLSSIINTFIACALISSPSGVLASSSSPEIVVPPPPAQVDASSGGRKNPVGQLAGYVKDSFVRLKDGTTQLYSNHKRCNEIRSKQKVYLANMAAALPESEQKKAKKYRVNAGGISYEEFDFLQRGKEDRSRVANVGFMMVFAPNFVPYAFMFFPEMLPSTFATPVNKLGTNFSKMDMISRDRAHAVLKTMINLERQARVAPMMSNINPFGKGRTKRMMERFDRLGHSCGALLAADSASGSKGANLVMNVLEKEIFTKEEPKKDRTFLTIVPKPIMTGLSQALDPSASNAFLPAFFLRGKVLNTLKQIQAADEFLVAQNVDLNTLNSGLLEDACGARLIGGPGRSDEEMIEGLANWLDLSVRKPSVVTKETGLHYNANLARTALLSYNAIDGARDARASSFIPRLMYQGQLYSSRQETKMISTETADKKRWSKISKK